MTRINIYTIITMVVIFAVNLRVYPQTFIEDPLKRILALDSPDDEDIVRELFRKERTSVEDNQDRAISDGNQMARSGDFAGIGRGILEVKTDNYETIMFSNYNGRSLDQGSTRKISIRMGESVKGDEVSRFMVFVNPMVDQYQKVEDALQKLFDSNSGVQEMRVISASESTSQNNGITLMVNTFDSIKEIKETLSSYDINNSLDSPPSCAVKYGKISYLPNIGQDVVKEIVDAVEKILKGKKRKPSKRYLLKKLQLNMLKKMKKSGVEFTSRVKEMVRTKFCSTD